jgi:hypothetical protein
MFLKVRDFYHSIPGNIESQKVSKNLLKLLFENPENQNYPANFLSLHFKMYSKIFLFLGLVLFASCSKFSKLQKSDDLELKKQGAYNYYDKKDYFRASQLLEELVPLLKGTQDAEKAEFLYAMCQYEVRLLESAAFYFSCDFACPGICITTICRQWLWRSISPLFDRPTRSKSLICLRRLGRGMVADDVAWDREMRHVSSGIVVLLLFLFLLLLLLLLPLHEIIHLG